MVPAEGLPVQALQLLLSPRCLSAVRITLVCTVFSILFAWILALPLAILFRSRSSAWLRAGGLLPGMAYALVVLGFLRLIGVQDPYSLFSVVLAWTLAGTLYIASGWVGLLRDLDPRQKEMLRVLGAGPIRAFYLHEFRRTLPGQQELLLQQVWLCFTSFSLVLILNGGPPNETLEVAIYSSLRLAGGSTGLTVALGIWQAFLLLVLRLLLLRVRRDVRHGARASGEWASTPVAGAYGKTRKIARALAIPLLLSAVVFWRLPGSEVSELVPPLGTSLLLGFCVSLLSSLFGFFCYFSGLRGLAGLASWTSPMILSFAVWSLWSGHVDPFALLLFVQVILFAPWFSREVFPLLDRSRKEELEAARVLGANPLRAWGIVEWPRIRGVVLRSAGLVFSLSLMEVTSVLLFSRGGFETLSSHTQNLFLRFRLEEAALGTALLIGIGMAMQLATEEVA